MSKPIEDYGFIGNLRSSGLVARDGSLDWLCLPDFDSDAVFAALLGNDENGRWQISPASEAKAVSRRYRPGTMIIETTFEMARGAVTLIDFMPVMEDDGHVEVIRIVRGDRGRVRMGMDLVMRFGYGRIVPWVRRTDYGLSAIAGPDALELHTRVELKSADFRTVSDFTVGAGATVPFVLAWRPSHLAPQLNIDAERRLKQTEAYWREWSGRCHFDTGENGAWRDAVVRSLITLKGLTFQPTGGVVAAATTSLPERIGGTRNWDYRFCWIRDATLTLYALLASGYRDEADAWRQWMLRAAAGHPTQLQIMYGVSGERRLPETELPWLDGYEGSKPVRIGNAAHRQTQLDVFGELLDALHAGRKYQLEPSHESWNFQKTLLGELEKHWRDADEGIWEVRSGPRNFTHSRLMAWVGFDRAIKGVQDFGLAGPVSHWKKIRAAIRDDILKNGWSDKRKAFVQSYGSTALDASLLLMPVVGFLPPTDPRIVSTVEAIQRELVEDGLVHRYKRRKTADGIGGGEGAFLVCTFWLADALTMLGRTDEATELFERLLGLRNDLGLLAEEYDPKAKRMLGNFPQAFSHVGIVNTANNLISAQGPAEQRADRSKGEQKNEPRKQPAKRHP